ncbi:MAG: transposase [Planctomycetes bacterium]|nr:transposase [Planctomycetota bacterium]
MAAKKKRSTRSKKTPEPQATEGGGSKAVRRWSKERKLEVILRLLRGEPIDSVSRDVGVESYRLEEWKDQALVAMKGGLGTRRKQDPVQDQLDAALKRVGELSMDMELMQIRCKRSGVSPFVRGRSKR